MLSEMGKLHLAQYMRENFIGTFIYDLEKKEIKSKYLLGVDVDTDYICIAMMDKGNGKILAHNEYKTESILAQPIYRKSIDTYKSEISDYCRDYTKEVYEHYINIFKVSHRDLEFINQLTKQELIERLNKHIKEKKYVK